MARFGLHNTCEGVYDSQGQTENPMIPCSSSVILSSGARGCELVAAECLEDGVAEGGMDQTRNGRNPAASGSNTRLCLIGYCQIFEAQTVRLASGK